MIEIRHVRSCNEPIRNGFATVVNWTSAGTGPALASDRLRRIVHREDYENEKKRSLHEIEIRAAIRFGIAATLLLLLIALGTPQPAHGQQVMAAITGKVTDPSGAAVAGRQSYGHRRRSGHGRGPPTTNADGIYDLPQVPDRNLQRQSGAHGISSRPAVNSVTLVLNQVARLDFQLKVGDVATSVNVTEAAAAAADRFHPGEHGDGRPRHREPAARDAQL